MKDGVQRNSPTPLPVCDATDEELAAQLKKSGGRRPVHHPVGELLGRHWEAAYSYARLCTDGAYPAGMLTTAAFTRLFEETARQGGPTAAWRPHLLVEIRRLAAEWDCDHRRTLLHPALRSHPGSDGRAAARLLPPENRRLVSRAFQRLAEPARCLLWHVEVEHEELAVPARLLGIETAEAEIRLERARELLRAVCLDVHREFAPDEECRRYARLLDVSLHRGDRLLDRDLRRHLDGCTHCHHTAEQVEGFHQRLPLLLAEGVLGWGAQAYLAARTPRTEAVRTAKAPMAAPVGGEPLIDPVDMRRPPAAVPQAPAGTLEPSGAPPASVAAAAPVGGRRAPRAAWGAHGLRAAAAHKAPRRPSPHRRQLALAVATVSALVLIPLTLWSGTRSGGDGRSRTGVPSAEPRPGAKGSGSGSPSWVGAAADVPTGAFEGRLRNQDSGLCIGLDEKKAAAGAEAVLVSCTSPASQQWAYEADGLLRSVAAPDLCLDSHLGYSVQLAPCAGQPQYETKDVRYDFTLQGALVPRWDQDLALTPASSAGGAGLVLKPRPEDDTQRWLADTSNTLRMRSVNWGTTVESAAPEPRTAGSHGMPSRRAGNGSRSTEPLSSPSPQTHGTCSSPYCAPNGRGWYGGYGGGYGGHGGRGGYRGYGGYGSSTGYSGYGGGQYDAGGGGR